MQQRVAVKAVIIEDGKCLLVKKEASRADSQFGLWEIPGGKVETGEPLSSDVELSPEHTAYMWLEEREVASAELHASVRADVLKGFQAIRAGG